MNALFCNAALDFARHFVRVSAVDFQHVIRTSAAVQYVRDEWLVSTDALPLLAWLARFHKRTGSSPASGLPVTCLYMSLVDEKYHVQRVYNYFSDDLQMRFYRLPGTRAPNNNPARGNVFHLMVRDGRDMEDPHLYYGGVYEWMRYASNVRYDEFRPIACDWKPALLALQGRTDETAVAIREKTPPPAPVRKRTPPPAAAAPKKKAHGAPSIAPKPSTYRGVRFRSRLEARYAAFFHYLGVEYHYEHASFRLHALQCTYTPDFWLPALGVYIEIKPDEVHDEERARCMQLARYGHDVVLVYGALGSPFLSEARGRTYQNSRNMQCVSWNRTGEQRQMAWVVDDVTGLVSLRANHYEWHDRLREACEYGNRLTFA